MDIRFTHDSGRNKHSGKTDSDKTRGHIDDLSHKLIPEFPDFVRSEYAQSINKIYIT